MRIPYHATSPTVEIRAIGKSGRRFYTLRPTTAADAVSADFISECGQWTTHVGNGFLWPHNGNTERRRVILSVDGESMR